MQVFVHDFPGFVEPLICREVDEPIVDVQVILIPEQFYDVVDYTRREDAVALVPRTFLQ